MEPYLSQVMKKYLHLFSTMSIVYFLHCLSFKEWQFRDSGGWRGMFGYFFALAENHPWIKNPETLITPKQYVPEIMSMWNRVYAHIRRKLFPNFVFCPVTGHLNKVLSGQDLTITFQQTLLINQVDIYLCSARAEFGTALAKVCKTVICM